MTKSEWGWFRVLYAIMAVLFIIAGIMLLMNPAFYAPFMIYMIGFMAIFYGAMLVIAYFMATNFKSVFTLITGILMIIAGIMTVSNVFSSSIALGAVIGIGLMVVGIFKIYQAFFVKKLGVSSWWTVLILAACNIILSIIMLCNLGDAGTLITILIGTNLLVNGVSDLMLSIVGF